MKCCWEDPSNSYLDDQVTRIVYRITRYCDAIASMIGDGRDAVYEDVRETYSLIS